MNSNTTKTFGVKASPELVERGNTLLEKLGGTKGEALAAMFDMVEFSLSKNGVSDAYCDHINAIDASIANIRTAALAIVSAAQEEKNRAVTSLRDSLQVKDVTIAEVREQRDATLENVKNLKEELRKAYESLDSAQLELSAREEDYKMMKRDMLARINDQAELIDMQREQIKNLKKTEG